MSDVPPSESQTSAHAAGEMLRQARERAGVHIAALAATLKVPVQRLEALEQGRTDALPDATFARALALSVCRVLKIDPAPVLAALPAGAPAQLARPTDALDTPMPRDGASPFGDGVRAARRLPLWVALALLVLAAVLWFVLPSGDGAPGAETTQSGPAAPSVAVPTAPATAVDAVGAPPVPSSAAVGPSTVVAAPVVIGETPPPAPQPAATDRPQPSATANGPDAAARIEVRAESWVQVIGASGRVLLQRTMQPGEVIRINEDLPLAVTIGRADATDVVVRGQPFDLGPVTRNNVARFEIR